MTLSFKLRHLIVKEHTNSNQNRTTGINQDYPREIKTYLFYTKGVKLESENNYFLVQKSQV